MHFTCDFCEKLKGQEFLYHCSICSFSLDIKCALLPELITGNFPKLSHSSHPHPLLFIEKHFIEGVNRSCFACEEPTSGSFYCCFECTFFLHQNCAQLPLKINHPSHRKHSLTLLPSYSHHENDCFCLTCKSDYNGFVYCCFPCKFSIRIRDTFSDLTFKAEIHEHAFSLIRRPMSFSCDACGTAGGENAMPWICTICDLVVHKRCIYLPRAIKLKRHNHSLSHGYFIEEDQGDRPRMCDICYDEVNMEYGSYNCSNCNYFVHVNCATDKLLWDFETIDEEDADEESNKALRMMSLEKLSSFRVIKEIGVGDDTVAAEIEHFSHQHILILEDKLEGKEEHLCDGCMRSIATAFYCCVECDFFLHKHCAELPRKKKHWNYRGVQTLDHYSFFMCSFCQFGCSGFAYAYGLDDDDTNMCIRCNEIPNHITTERHEHPLVYHYKELLDCSICDSTIGRYRCKICDFVLCRRCITMPPIVWSKHHIYEFDEHPLALIYHDDIPNSNQCYCDKCEKPRDPKKWFYYCALCDYSFHCDCALGMYPYVKLRSRVKLEIHQHPLTFVKEDFVRYICDSCKKRCEDVFLKCAEQGCKYVVDFDCYMDWLGRDDYQVRLQAI